MNANRKIPVFPLIRHLSVRTTPVLARLPVTANQITAASLVSGLAAAWYLTLGTQAGAVWAGVLFVIAYVLDNCDGEIARLKDQCSTFGMWFDTFVDWAVHTLFFIALGLGVSRSSGEDLWLWMGLAAAAGGSLNFAIALVHDIRDKGRPGAEEAIKAPRDPEGVRDWLVFAFRELTRADFCFIVLALAGLDLIWFLLPAGAIGAQVYWITQFIRGARDFHV